MSHTNLIPNHIGEADYTNDRVQTLQAYFNATAYFATACIHCHWTANYLSSTNTRYFRTTSKD
jgi:hypothetical protein